MSSGMPIAEHDEAPVCLNDGKGSLSAPGQITDSFAVAIGEGHPLINIHAKIPGSEIPAVMPETGITAGEKS